MVSDKWKKIKIHTKEQLIKLWDNSNPQFFGIDTETDGIFQMTTKPFLIIFGWYPKNIVKEAPIVTLFEPTDELMETMYKLCGQVNYGVMHNAKFDMHAMENGYKKFPHKNILDTMIVARLILEAVPATSGGPLLALKKLANKYIEKSADTEQKQIKRIKHLIQTERRLELEKQILAIKRAPVDNWQPKDWTKPKLEKWDADPIKEQEYSPPIKVLKVWEAWTKKYPRTKGKKTTERVTYKDIYNYSTLAKNLMEKYAYKDVIYTIELFIKFMPWIVKFGLIDTLIREKNTMYALYESERTGLKIDKDYLTKAKDNLKQEILECRLRIQNILGKDYSAATFASSPQQIKTYLIERGWTKNVSTSKDSLIGIIEELKNIKIGDAFTETRELLEDVIEHRRLLKKYSTDLLGYERNEWNGRRYTTYNQTATVTGRLSNDLQQMANEGIYNKHGIEIFHPRQVIIPSIDEGYSHIAYLDYSQIEVRLQAHYTWVAMKGTGDTNLLRMYVPFKCFTIINNEKIMWDPDNHDHVDEEFIEKNNWIQIENNKPWEITDMHMLTARTAFPELKGLPNDDELVQKKRKKAKNLNFAIQYGAGKAKVISMAGNDEEGKKLYDANKSSFIGLVKYGEMLKKFYTKYGYVENAYGRKYKTKYFSHKFANYVIQGTGAEILKEKLIKCTEFLKDKKSRAIHNIHDEIQFEIHKDELDLIPKLKAIMEETDNKFVVPIIADIETTTTNWKEKQEGII